MQGVEVAHVQDTPTAAPPAAQGQVAEGQRVAGGISAPRTLFPHSPTLAISRNDLNTLLEQASSKRLTSVCAGPGWGKTMAVSGWLERRPAARRTPVAWLTARRESDNLASFWDDVLAALRSCGAVPDDHPLQSLSASAGIFEEVLRSLQVGLDSLPTRTLLVIDDFQEVTDPSVLDSVRLTTELVSMLNLVLVSRITPTLPLHRLRVAGELTEISAEDLAFTNPEIEALARSTGLELTPAQVELVFERTEGWPAGVRLALLSASRSGTGALASFAGTNRSVAEYLAAEVLARNDPPIRDFLLRTSVTEQICADLAAAIAPEVPAQKVLELLEGRNEFVTAMGPDRLWFRYHPLLRDLLDHELRRDDREAHRHANRAAARWWAERGEPISALSHAAAAEDWELFGSLYTTCAGPSLVGVQRYALRDLLATVPHSTQPDSAGLHLVQAGTALVAGQLGAMVVQTDLARQLQAGAEPPQSAQRVLTELLTCAGGRFQGDPDRVVRAGSAAIALLDEAGPIPAAAGYRLIALQNLGVGRFWAGDLVGARSSFNEVVSAAEKPDIDLARLGARSHLALTHAAEADLDRALSLAANALEWAGPRGWSSVLQARPAHLAVALVQLLRGEAGAAHSAIVSGLAAVTGGAEPTSTLMLHALHAETALSQGRLRAAGLSLRQALASAQAWQPTGMAAQCLAHAATEVALLAPEVGVGELQLAGPEVETPLWASSVARRQLAGGDPASALRTAQALVATGDPETILDLLALVEGWLVIALAKDQLWAGAGAARAMARALAIAEPQAVVRPFLATGSTRVPSLIHQARRDGSEGDPFLESILAGLAGSGPMAGEPAPLAEPLTERELSMLRALPTMRSNTEIAADSYVSVNTVKAHLKSLFRKLEVTSRREAVERARELGLLD